MSNIIFKISNPLDGCTRRLAFTSAPSWAELAGKLENIYSIPKEDVCVSYTNAIGDILVLSTDAELKEYYATFLREQTDDSVRAIRFAVKSLSSIREAGGNMHSVSADHEKTPTSPAADDIGAPVLSVQNSGASSMEVDYASDPSVHSDGEIISRGESPPLPDIEALFALHPMHSRGRGGHFGGGRGRGRFHGHHDPRDGIPLPPFPSFIPSSSLRMPSTNVTAVPPLPPFAMLGLWDRGGRHAHVYGRGGMRGHPYHLHGHLGHDHGHPFHYLHHYYRPHRPAVHMSVPQFAPSFPPMRDGFMMSQRDQS
ncbi:hypothetical protein PHLGIDRAFT_459391 [Phlebiopsis gigantea 11061_1 CR5-6]|uniref:PB1 domain-containing protein n=1 Tax=Phlebiopsis gigantea (strain 11061_1 CR5-6) TaxID=745531 RepID=A0A0C3PJR6_PHLG1|nr:hypothetical protein PHLGIDRAFT_459391 [Phlebiopsis gigantea 11061_1 CR5-6]